MIAEFQNHWEDEYKIKTSEQLQSVIDKRNTLNEKNSQTQLTIRMYQHINLLSPLSDLLGASTCMDVNVDSGD